MTDTTLGSSGTGKRRRWLRALIWGLGGLVVLLVVAYFVGTSSAFFKGVILPRVGKAMNAQITVSDASISPFSQVVLRNLKVQTTGAEPLVTVAEVRLRYSLMAILGGNIRVDEVAVVAPTVTLVKNPNGSSNLDPILKAQAAEAPAKEAAPPAQAAKPPQIDLKKFALTDATIRQIKNHANGTRDLAELSQVNVTLSDLKNGQTGRLAMNGDIRVEHTNGLMQAKLGGDFTFALAADLKPASVKGGTRLDVTRAEGALADFASFGGSFYAEVTPTDIKDMALRFQKGDIRLGELRVSGPFDMQKLEGRLSIVLSPIDKRLLNLVGAQQGLDFGPTTISSTNEIELASAGSVINARGRVDVSAFQVTRTNQTTPRLDLLCRAYDVTVDRWQSNAVLRSLTLTGTQNGNPLLKAELTSPMQIDWGKANAVGGPLTLTLSGLNLADWKPFLGEVAPAGMANATAKITPQQGGQVAFDFDSRIEHLTVNAGSNQISDATITLQAGGKATDLEHKAFTLTGYKLEVARQNQTLATVSGSGTCGVAAETADMQLTAKAALAPLLQAMPQPDMSVSSGTVDLKAHLVQKQETQTVTGTFALADFTGRFGQNELQRFGVTADFDVGLTPEQIQVRKAAGNLTQAGNVGGTFGLVVTYDLAKESADLTARLANWNQTVMAPFLAPMLADKQLVSVALNATAAAQYNPQGASAVKADLQVSNLVVKDPTGQIPATPLEAKMQMDASLRNQVADLRQFQFALTPTARATNQVQLSGRVDMSRTNALQGDLKLVADSLDLTRYYDLFMGGKPAPAPATAPAARTEPAAAPAAPAAPAKADQEPEPIQLPFRDFTASASIRRLYLHEVEIADWQTTVKIDGGHVALNPFKLTLNGAPVNTTMDLDLGVPGWKYDLSLSAQAVPLAPLVNSLQPELSGQVGGTATAQARITGAGVTGASLQKNLSGQFDMSSTNLNYSVVNIKNPVFKGVINVIAGIPELLRNPAAGLGSLLGNLTGGVAGTKGGLADDLQRSPIDTITARTRIGAGTVDLQQAVVQSAAFRADATGTITLAPVLTNSAIQIPVAVFLSQPIAQRINLASADTNAAYAKLPDFLTMRGTVGEPKADINKLALAGTAVKSITGFVPAAEKTATGLVESLLGTKSSGTTNQPATNQSPVNSLIRGIFGPKKK